MTNTPTITIGPTGPIAPEVSTILTGVQADINAAFGGSLSQDPTTVQGQLAVALTSILSDCNDTFLNYVAGVDPLYSSGRMQDGLGRIYFLTRNPAQATTVQALCSGASGVIIPEGALAVATDGSVYACTSARTIPIGGSITLPFANIVTGPIPLGIGSLNTIYQTIPGWDSITNAAAGVLGNNVESRAAFEDRRTASVALNAYGVLGAIKGNVLQVANVLDCYAYDNATSSSVTVGGVTIAANSLYVCAAGGVAASIALAIWQKKNPGCAYTGTTTVTVTDTNPSYAIPLPTYPVSFTVAAALPITMVVSIANSIGVPANALTLVQNAVMAAFSGLDGGSSVKIGALLFASRFYAGIAALGTWAQIISITVNGGNDVAVNINQIPTIASGSISLTLV